MTAKRYDELLYFGKELVPYRETFKAYSLSSLKFMMVLYSVLTVFLLFILFLMTSPKLLVLIPVYMVFFVWLLHEVITGKAKSIIRIQRKLEG